MRVVFDGKNMNKTFLEAIKRKSKSWRALIAVFTLIIIVVAVVIMLTGGKEGIIFGGVIGALGILYAPCLLLLAKKNNKKQSETNKMLSSVCRIVFDEMQMVSELNGEYFKGMEFYLYDGMFRVEDYGDLLVFYINNMLVSAIIDKQTVVEGNVEELCNMLKIRLGAKYIVKNAGGRRAQ